MNEQTGLYLLEEAYDLAVEEGRLADTQEIDASMKAIKFETDEEYIESEVTNCLAWYGGEDDEEDDYDDEEEDNEDDDDL